MRKSGFDKSRFSRKGRQERDGLCLFAEAQKRKIAETIKRLCDSAIKPFSILN